MLLTNGLDEGILMAAVGHIAKARIHDAETIIPLPAFDPKQLSVTARANSLANELVTVGHPELVELARLASRELDGTREAVTALHARGSEPGGERVQRARRDRLGHGGRKKTGPGTRCHLRRARRAGHARRARRSPDHPGGSDP